MAKSGMKNGNVISSPISIHEYSIKYQFWVIFRFLILKWITGYESFSVFCSFILRGKTGKNSLSIFQLLTSTSEVRWPKHTRTEEINMRVSHKMIRAMAKQMYGTVSDSRDEEFAVNAGWLHRFLRHNNSTCRKGTTLAQQDSDGNGGSFYCTESLESVKMILSKDSLTESFSALQLPQLISSQRIRHSVNNSALRFMFTYQGTVCSGTIVHNHLWEMQCCSEWYTSGASLDQLLYQGTAGAQIINLLNFF